MIPLVPLFSVVSYPPSCSVTRQAFVSSSCCKNASSLTTNAWTHVLDAGVRRIALVGNNYPDTLEFNPYAAGSWESSIDNVAYTLNQTNPLLRVKPYSVRYGLAGGVPFNVTEEDVTRAFDNLVNDGIQDVLLTYLWLAQDMSSIAYKQLRKYPHLRVLTTFDTFEPKPIRQYQQIDMSTNFQSAYLSGYVCGLETKTNKIAVSSITIGFLPYDKVMTNVFEMGAKAANPNVSVYYTDIDTFLPPPFWADKHLEQLDSIHAAQPDVDIVGIFQRESVAFAERVRALGMRYVTHDPIAVTYAPDVLLASHYWNQVEMFNFMNGVLSQIDNFPLTDGRMFNPPETNDHRAYLSNATSRAAYLSKAQELRANPIQVSSYNGLQTFTPFSDTLVRIP